MVVSKTVARKVLVAVHGTDRSPNVLHPMYSFVRAHHRVLNQRREVVEGLCVDVGCGDRYFETFYRGRYTRYVGVDYLPAETRGIAGQPVERRRGPEFQDPDMVADGAFLPLRSALADTVLLIEVLEHVPEPGRLLAEIARVLKPGGHLLLTTPFAIPEHAQPYDFYRFTQFGLRHLVQQAGFQVLALEPVASAGGVVAYFVNMFPIVGTFRASRSARLLKAVCAPMFFLLWGAMNILAIAWDRLFPKDGFTVDYFVLAQRR
jgi:SAM-dependent methyltransferase